jgi:hypothetical protein
MGFWKKLLREYNVRGSAYGTTPIIAEPVIRRVS